MREKNILLILISMFIVTIAWIGFSLYNKHARSTITEVLQMQVQPIPSHFDTEVIEELKKRKKVEPQFDAVAIESPDSTQSATPTSIQRITPTAIEPEPTLP